MKKPKLPLLLLFVLCNLMFICYNSCQPIKNDSSISELLRMPLLMLDDFEELNNVWWRVEEAVQDDENPLLEGDMPWNAGGIGIHGTVLRDPIDGKYKAWIVTTPPQEELKGICSATRYRRLCYFESTDGVHWTWPKLPNSEYEEYEATNIIFNDVGGTQYASVDINPEREWPYEMFVFRRMYGQGVPGYTKMYNYRSRDGKIWEEMYGPIKGPFVGDLAFIYPARLLYPDSTNGYVAYYRLSEFDAEAHIPKHDNTRPGHGRMLYRAESVDGKEWINARKIIARDERDHRDVQYMELIPERVPGGYIGVISVYSGLSQTMNLRLAASRDGIIWWFPDRRSCLDNPPLGEYGGGMIWQSKNLVVEGNQLYVYYSGQEGLHSQIWDTRGKKLEYLQVGLERVFNSMSCTIPFNSALCRASWRIDRLYAMASASGGPAGDGEDIMPEHASKVKFYLKRAFLYGFDIHSSN